MSLLVVLLIGAAVLAVGGVGVIGLLTVRRRQRQLPPPGNRGPAGGLEPATVLPHDDTSDANAFDADTSTSDATVSDANVSNADIFQPDVPGAIPPELPAEILPEEIVLEEIVRPRFRDRLGKARSLLGGYFGSVLGRSQIDQSTWDDLEEALVRADVGIATTTGLLGELKTRVKSEGITTGEELLEALRPTSRSVWCQLTVRSATNLVARMSGCSSA